MAFEKYSRYGNTNFCLLNAIMPDEKAQKIYYERWMTRYAKLFKDGNDENIIEWDLRTRKAMKEVLTSASFYVEATCVYKSSCFSASYYLMYYSLFHAMLSSLWLDDKQTIDNLIVINHSKIANCFFSNFCTPKQSLISNDIQDLWEDLRFLREYYSYSMPLNDMFDEELDIEKLTQKLKKKITQCFQITSLHSVMFENSFGKHGRLVKINNDNWVFFWTLFDKVNGKKHSKTKTYLLDPADKSARSELINNACGIECITLDIEHHFDEFRGYHGVVEAVTEPKIFNVSDIWTLVWKSIC